SAQTAAVAASPSDLRNLERKLGQSVYWAGGEAGVTYELTQSAGGRVYIRYLPGGVTLGSSQPYLTVATYPYKGAYAAPSATAAEPGSVRVNFGGGVGYHPTAQP